MKILFLAFTVFLLAGCGLFTKKQSSIVEVGDKDQLKDCLLLQTFEAPAGPRFWGTPYMGNFKIESIKKAEKIGATHMVSGTEVDGIGATTVLQAYKCPPGYEAMKPEEEE
jgi:hypothetical protein